LSALSSYRSLARAAGPFTLLISFLARLPAAMAPLGTIMLVATSFGGYATAGLATAALGVAAALGGPLVGGLADRYGQRRVVLVAVLLDAAGLVALVAACRSGVLLPTLAAAAVVGAATPQVGPLARVRWAALLGDRGRQRDLPTAMSYEGAADELSYLGGPALVGLLAMTGVAVLPLLAAAVLTVAAGVPFALHPSAPPVLRVPAAPGGGRAAGSDRMPVAALAVLVGAMVCIGTVFGATQTGVAAFARHVGQPGAAGLVYSVLGIGSALAGLATAWLPARFTVAARYPVFAATLLAGTAGLLLVGSTGTALAAMGLMGVTAAPYLIAGYALTGRITPARRAGTAMTLLASGVVAGVALGAAVAGRLADTAGYRGALLVPPVAAAAGLVLALTAYPGLRRLAAGAADRPAPAPVDRAGVTVA
jgi:MFS family permease